MKALTGISKDEILPGEPAATLQHILRLQISEDEILPGEPVLPAATYGPPRPGDLRSSLLDARKIQRELGWHPQVTLAEGLKRTAAWFAGRALTFTR